MVCIPCIVIPFCLWIFHRFIRPILLKIWNPWGPKKAAVASNDKTSKNPVVDLKTKSENGELKKTDKNNQNDLDESKKPLLSDSDPLINTKMIFGFSEAHVHPATPGDSALQQLKETCVSDKKRD